jgi:hypothetical protein
MGFCFMQTVDTLTKHQCLNIFQQHFIGLEPNSSDTYCHMLLRMLDKNAIPSALLIILLFIHEHG